MVGNTCSFENLVDSEGAYFKEQGLYGGFRGQAALSQPIVLPSRSQRDTV